VAARSSHGQAPELPPAVASALDAIRADSLRGHLSFLASDLLEGRDTPSRGLDLAAEYIAAQFRRAGLEPIGDDGYFQTARWKVAGPDPATFAFVVRYGDQLVHVTPDRVSLAAPGPIDLGPTQLSALDTRDVEALDTLPEGAIKDKAVVVSPPTDRAARNAFFNKLRQLGPALAITLEPDVLAGGLGRGRLIDPEAGGGRAMGGFAPSGPRRIAIHDAKAAQSIASWAGKEGAIVELRLGPPVERSVTIRNVAGRLSGSDPELASTAVLVTAHYDHLGIGEPQDGDKIYNGANDDGSGTVSVIEIASALASLREKDRPKRSLVFLCFFGEEKGLLGSRYYGRHPLVPLERTVAQVNLEHMGRTDDTEGPRVGAVSVTGYDYSTLTEALRKAGEATGVKVEKHPRNSDAFFGASDNQALADLGVPAHSVCTSFIFPEYHRPGDHWDKVDYANMAKVDRMVALALLGLANDPKPPAWNADNPRAARYLKAQEKLKAGGEGP
jgi:hypothetical protein